MARYNKLAIQVLSLLANGLLLGYSRNGREKRELLNECDKIWLAIDRNHLFDALRILRLQGLVDIIERNDKFNVRITDRGKIRSGAGIIFNLNLKKQKKWDGKWRLVIFDIPEERKKIRDSFRSHLKRLGFVEFQKSVFAFPYPCEDEIAILINFHRLNGNVRYMDSQLSYDADLRKAFLL